MKAKVIGLGFIILFKFYDITCIKTFSVNVLLYCERDKIVQYE